jgi:hypothetical protein
LPERAGNTCRSIANPHTPQKRSINRLDAVQSQIGRRSPVRAQAETGEEAGGDFFLMSKKD